MTINYQQFTKDIRNIDLTEICSDWQWLLNNQYTPIIVSCSGDLFLINNVGQVFWLDTGLGQLQNIASNIDEFYLALTDLDNIDKWLLASTVLDLIELGMLLKENEVYSYKKLPILSGDYSSHNFETADIGVHFSFTGQICRQVKDLPLGTKINNVTFSSSTKDPS